jgi:hypothetical protein
MKYLLPLLLLVACGPEKGKEYFKNTTVCIESHSETYTCLRYSVIFKRMMPQTCTKNVCDEYECYLEKYRSNGFWKRDDLLKKEEISCK